jgi:subtilisin family serine protease
MASRLCKLESAEDAPSLLRGYDPSTEGWDYSFDSEFWKAVDHAHRLGRRGGGRKVAVIDTACDLRVPALRGRVDRVIEMSPQPLSPGGNEHGTAVALLIARVAPDCRFDIYPVRRDDGSINASDVAHAIGQAAASDADVVNVSLGAWQCVPDIQDRVRAAGREAVEACLFGPSPKQATQELLNRILPDPDCDLCRAATAAAAAGKLVLAAAGNDPGEILCPARAERVFSIGFQRSKRTVVNASTGDYEVAEGLSPEAPQSYFWDISLPEISGVLGTSFASPLYAGVAALGVTAAEFSAYLSAVPVTMLASQFQAQLNISVAETGRLPEGMERVQEGALRLFAAALRRLPHVHTRTEALEKGGGRPIADPASCATCGLFAAPLYVNCGLFLLQSGNIGDGMDLLSAARALAPWSCDAAANLGRALEHIGDLNSALRHYDDACRLRPGFAVYEDERKRILAAMRGSPTGSV